MTPTPLEPYPPWSPPSSRGTDIAASSTSLTSSQGPSSSDPPPESESPTKIWIVGAVVGPVAVLALMGTLALLLWRRRSGKRFGNRATELPANSPIAVDSKAQELYSPIQPVEKAEGFTSNNRNAHDSGALGPYSIGSGPEWRS